MVKLVSFKIEVDMNTNEFQLWMQQNPAISISVVIILSALMYLLIATIITRGLHYMASRTATKVDDILLKNLRPYRIAWLAPLVLIYSFAYVFGEFQLNIRNAALFFIMWVSVLVIVSLLNAINEIYETRPSFNGVSIQSYLDIVKIILMLVAIILSISIFTGESPVVLLTGLGALMAVLLLIFQSTILSLVASVQISSQDLIKEGDWIEVPEFGADGDVVNISLHTIKIQNFDMTFTVIPTYKIVDVAYKNWRGMKESGGRRIQRHVLIDMTTMKFCDSEMLARLRKIDLIQGYLDAKIQALEDYRSSNPSEYDSPLDGPQITNTELFRAYIVAYLKTRKDIHQERMPFLVRTLAPNPTGMPIELYIFTKTTTWEEYEAIQAEIFDQLLAAAWHFDLRVFQEPTGLDFSAMANRFTYQT
jgi:miniconductance mechanosensitive channel